MKNNNFSVVFAAPSTDEYFARESKVKVNITLDKDQQLGQPIIDAFQCELSRRIKSVFPSTSVTVKKGSIKTLSAKRWKISFKKFGKMRAGVK